MNSYRVTWEIDVMAGNPRKAAEEARRIQRDRESIATVFTVRRKRDEDICVDLADAESDGTIDNGINMRTGECVLPGCGCGGEVRHPGRRR